MAAIEFTSYAPSKPGLFSRFFAQLHRETDAYIRRNSRHSEMVTLEGKSDAELARLGVKRSEIALYVYGDRIWF